MGQVVNHCPSISISVVSQSSSTKLRIKKIIFGNSHLNFYVAKSNTSVLSSSTLSNTIFVYISLHIYVLVYQILLKTGSMIKDLEWEVEGPRLKTKDQVIAFVFKKVLEIPTWTKPEANLKPCGRVSNHSTIRFVMPLHQRSYARHKRMVYFQQSAD